MTEESPTSLEQKDEASESASSSSFYSKEELEYQLELQQLVHPTPSGDLREGKLGIRTFAMITGRVVMAIVVHELTDSFITVLPISFGSEDDGTLSIKRASPTAMSRIYKTSLGLSSVPQPVFTVPYLKEVKKYVGELPGFFNPARISQVDSLIIQLNTASIKSTPEEVEGYGDAYGARPGNFTPPEHFASRTKH